MSMEQGSESSKNERLYGLDNLLKEIKDSRESLDYFERLAKEGKYNDEFAEDLCRKIREFFDQTMEDYDLCQR